MSGACRRERAVAVEINGTVYEREVEARRLLVHFIRDDCDLTGTHVGCDTGNCGACTVLLDGHAVKSCMLLAVQADGHSMTTVEGLAAEGELDRAAAGVLRPPCAPVRLLHAGDADERHVPAAPQPRADRRGDPKAMQGNICRCTGYWNIVGRERCRAAAGRSEDA